MPPPTPSSGGAIRNAGTLTVDNSTLSSNAVARAGGAIEATSGSSTTVTRSTMSGNATGPVPGNSGALHLTGEGTVDISNTEVAGNTAANECGGIPAANGGGGVFNQSGDLSVFQTRFVHNSTSREGGGIETVAGTVTIESSWIIGDGAGSAPGNGGGRHLGGPGVVDVSRSYFGNNTAANEAGALCTSAAGTMTPPPRHCALQPGQRPDRRDAHRDRFRVVPQHRR